MCQFQKATTLFGCLQVWNPFLNFSQTSKVSHFYGLANFGTFTTTWLIPPNRPTLGVFGPYICPETHWPSTSNKNSHCSHYQQLIASTLVGVAFNFFMAMSTDTPPAKKARKWPSQTLFKSEWSKKWPCIQAISKDPTKALCTVKITHLYVCVN